METGAGVAVRHHHPFSRFRIASADRVDIVLIETQRAIIETLEVAAVELKRVQEARATMYEIPLVGPLVLVQQPPGAVWVLDIL